MILLVAPRCCISEAVCLSEWCFYFFITCMFSFQLFFVFHEDNLFVNFSLISVLNLLKNLKVLWAIKFKLPCSKIKSLVSTVKRVFEPPIELRRLVCSNPKKDRVCEIITILNMFFKRLISFLLSATTFRRHALPVTQLLLMSCWLMPWLMGPMTRKLISWRCLLHSLLNVSSWTVNDKLIEIIFKYLDVLFSTGIPLLVIILDQVYFSFKLVFVVI